MAKVNNRKYDSNFLQYWLDVKWKDIPLLLSFEVFTMAIECYLAK